MAVVYIVDTNMASVYTVYVTPERYQHSDATNHSNLMRGSHGCAHLLQWHCKRPD
jgi:hypothetical protein